MTIDQVVSKFTSLQMDRPGCFEAMAEAVYLFQRACNPIYGRYCKVLATDPSAWNGWTSAPALPVAAFKQGPVTAFPPEEAVHVFESSGTGRGTPSKHYVRSLALYEKAVAAHFASVFGRGPFTLVAHLPRYAERGERSSLLYMMEHLVRRFGNAQSGLFLEDRSLLHAAIAHSQETEHPLLLFGAAFGLLDLVEDEPVVLPPVARVVETGGMKTYRRRIDRAELHARLAEGFRVSEAQIWSEYGMCELMSQAYTRGGSVFFPPPWLRFRVVDPARPDCELPEGAAGALVVFDLANVYSVAALQTEDRAVRRGDGFEVLGRLEQAELRGCNFLVKSNG